jgi:hypothetical protein
MARDEPYQNWMNKNVGQLESALGKEGYVECSINCVESESSVKMYILLACSAILKCKEN